MGLEARQSQLCPYCGATWNEPAARFCAKCHLQLPPSAGDQPAATEAPLGPSQAPHWIDGQTAPVVRVAPEAPLPAMPASWLAAYRRLVFVGGAIVAVLGTLGTLISVGQTAAGSEAETIRAVLAEQPTIDAAMTQFLSGGAIVQDRGLDAVRAESDRRLNQYRESLNKVQKEEATLRKAQSTLKFVGPLSLGSGQGSTLDRRAAAALSALAEAEQVLTAAVDQEIAGRAVFETVLKEQQMLDAIKQQQYMQADRIDADADHALLPADWRRHYNDIPPQMGFLIGTVRLMIDNTDMVAMFTIRNQTEPLTSAQEEVRSTVADYNKLSSDTVMAENDAWNSTKYLPKVESYQNALSDLNSH